MKTDIKTYKDILTEEEIKELQNLDTAYNKKRALEMEKFHGKKIIESIVSHMKKNGVIQYKPDGMSWKQAHELRVDRTSMQSAILYDYDGCSAVNELKSLLREARESMLMSLLCFPEIYYGSSSSRPYLKNGQYNQPLSIIEKQSGLLLYALPAPTDGYPGRAYIPIEEIWLGDDVVSEEELAANNFSIIHSACLAYRKNQDLLWSICDYMNKAHEQKESIPSAPTELTELLTVGRSVVDYYAMNGSPSYDKEYDSKKYIERDAQFINLLVQAIGYADKQLSFGKDIMDAEYWKKSIDDTMAIFDTFWILRKEERSGI